MILLNSSLSLLFSMPLSFCFLSIPLKRLCLGLMGELRENVVEGIED